MTDSGETAFVLSATAWAAYAAVHSALASDACKRRVLAAVPAAERFYRVAFNALAVLLLLPTAGATRALAGAPLWTWSGGTGIVADALALIALAGFLWSARHYCMAEFLGLRQLRGAGTSCDAFVISPLHRFVRHPWYALALVLVWTRDMDAARLGAAVAISAYLVVGSRLEEGRLLAALGPPYARYRRAVPALLPHPWRWLRRDEARRIAAGGTAETGRREQ